MTLLLGKAPARPGAIKPMFADIIDTSKLATPPAEFGHDQLVGNRWGMLANDQVGDCAIADALHQHLLWNLERGVAIPLSDSAAVANYSAVTGYDPSKPDSDQGIDVPELIKYRLNTGLVDAAGRTHKIGAAVSLEPGNWEQLIYALYYFDGVTLGVNLPQEWQDAFGDGTGPVVWDETDSESLGGHAITGVAFHDDLARIVTWGSDVVGITEAGYVQASDETFAVLSEERFNRGIDINGFDYAKLAASLPLLQDISSAA